MLLGVNQTWGWEDGWVRVGVADYHTLWLSAVFGLGATGSLVHPPPTVATKVTAFQACACACACTNKLSKMARKVRDSTRGLQLEPHVAETSKS
jgi:hypothetical protein